MTQSNWASPQTRPGSASLSPRILSPYKRQRCGSDPISSSDWISGGRRRASEPLIPPSISILHSYALYTLLHFFYGLLDICLFFFTLHLYPQCVGYKFFPLATLFAASSTHLLRLITFIWSSSPRLTSCLFWNTFSFEPLSPPSLTAPRNTTSFMLGVSGALEVKEETEGRGVEGREGEGWVSVELVGRSGAAPPVIIRVTAARARLCAACTRRDVLPRERSEHLSVPPRRQQPPTSLSNSTQLVTRSPNSYFLSLTHTRSWTTLHFSCCLAHSLLHRQLLSLTRVRTGCESSRPWVQCRLQKK